MKFFLPEWNDVIFREYDFLNDNIIDDQRIYSHELFKGKIFDGLLVSKSYLEETKSRLMKMKSVGIHEFLRFKGEIIGDCGAWSYSKQQDPPYSVEETLTFYDKLGVDYGVSLDHLCNTKNIEENERRRQLTLINAETFFQQHQNKSYNFKRIGVAQGWNVETYQDSVKELLDIGYNYIGIGGLAGAKTEKIIPVLQGIQNKNNLRDVHLHLFGVARLSAIREFQQFGVRSFDSASPLRHAWLGPGKNYKNHYYKGYSAFRLPFVDRAGSKYMKELKESGKYTIEELKTWESNLHKLLLDFDNNNSVSIDQIITEYSKFDNLLGIEKQDYSKRYVQTLIDKPWKNCDCVFCERLGIEVMIFRGNERNKRRGFHNVFTFYNLLQKILSDKEFNFLKFQDSDTQTQLSEIKIENLAKASLTHNINLE